MLNLNLKHYLKTCAFFSVTLLSLTACSANEKVDYELTGRALDSVTKQPLEGVYVVAAYMGSGGTFAGHSGSWCRKTRGMYTKADGKFSFPVEGRGVDSPMPPVGIKPGYSGSRLNLTKANMVMIDAKRYYTDQNLLLTPQDPAKPDLAFQEGEAYCTRAKSKQDAAAGAEFFKIALAEHFKYGAPRIRIESYQNTVSRLESLPNASANPTK